MIKIAKKSDVKDKLCVKAKGKALALFKIKEKYYCTDNKCTHLGGPLCKGNIEDHTIVCPWHGAKFDVKTGKVKGLPAKADIKTYKVEIKGDDILVDL